MENKSSSRVTAAHLKRYDPVRQAKTETEAEASDGLKAPPIERGEWFRKIIGLVAGLVEEWKVHLSRIPQATSAFVPALDLDRGAPRD